MRAMWWSAERGINFRQFTQASLPMPDGQGKFDGSTIEDNSKVADIEPCPSCGALPCDWCKNPWEAMPLTDEQALELGRDLAELRIGSPWVSDRLLSSLGRIAFKRSMELAKEMGK